MINPTISVIIPVYRDWKRLMTCLLALDAQSLPSNKFEIIVVNNDPLDNPPKEILLKRISLLVQPIKGSYAARNKGISAARGSILAFTDADCIPDVDWLRNAEIGMLNGCERIAGNIILFYKSKQLSISEIYEKKFAFAQEKYVKLGFGATANMIALKRHFDLFGLFRQDIFSSGDYEWGKVASNCNIGIYYLPSVIVRHPARNTLKQLIQKRRRINAAKILISKEKLVPQDITKVLISLLPPVITFLSPRNRQDISLFNWLGLIFLVWYLKIDCSIHAVLIKAKLCEPQRY
ncbi:glycosyltransferase [Synechococcus sp. AH-551-N23]|nr:glycosyltransferase [Synechococcus sp. AH-551-N23]